MCGEIFRVRSVRVSTDDNLFFLRSYRSSVILVVFEAWYGQHVLVAVRCAAFLGTPRGPLTRSSRGGPLKSGTCRPAGCAASCAVCRPGGRQRGFLPGGRRGRGRPLHCASWEGVNRTAGFTASSRAGLAADRSWTTVRDGRSEKADRAAVRSGGTHACGTHKSGRSRLRLLPSAVGRWLRTPAAAQQAVHFELHAGQGPNLKSHFSL